jgi:murein DD-endopeptidase MepM/ murein hydrolase activator NlpD
MLKNTIILSLAILLFSCGNNQENTNGEVLFVDSVANIDSIYEPNELFGFIADSFEVYEGVIKPNDFLSNILLKYNVPYSEIDKLAKVSKDVYDVRKIAAGKKYTVFCKKDSTGKAVCFVYQPNKVEYVVYELGDSITVRREKKEVVTRIRTASGTINSSLYQTLANQKISPVLAVKLADIYAWTIDFYRIQKGDWFKVIFEEKYVDDEFVGIGKIIASDFNHFGKDFYAFYFMQDSTKGADYFDEDGNSLRKAFLQSPLKFGRLTSGYTLKRFHPVQKRFKAHLGTDYAAPAGTPILATGNGVVIASSYSKFNGNYVKIKHNGTYTTQYLHMSKRAVKVGQYVKQGQVIGYVGSTGLATGPHVCYRFWKNGKQVNHRNEELPPSEPIKPEYRDKFTAEVRGLKQQLDAIQLQSGMVIQ